MNRFTCFSFALIAACVFAGCPRQNPADYKNPSGMDRVGDGKQQDGDHHGPALELGNATIANWTVRASRDEGAVTAGGEVPADVWVTGPEKFVAVRFWIGTQDAVGSIKVLAPVEDAADPTHRHTHVEVPNPIPAGSMFWVEIESESGAKHTGSFDLKL